MCTSWPQACMTPGASEAKSAPVASVSGRASMSARSAAVGPGRPPSKRAITAVSSSRWWGRPSPSRTASIRATVANSRFPSSGCR